MVGYLGGMLATRRPLPVACRKGVVARSLSHELAARVPTAQRSSSFSVHFDDIYRVILHGSAHWDDLPFIAKKVKRAVPLVESDEAQRIVEAAVARGSAIVVTVTKSDAGDYSRQLRRQGLQSHIEPA